MCYVWCSIIPLLRCKIEKASQLRVCYNKGIFVVMMVLCNCSHKNAAAVLFSWRWISCYSFVCHKWSYQSVLWSHWHSQHQAGVLWMWYEQVQLCPFHASCLILKPVCRGCIAACSACSLMSMIASYPAIHMVDFCMNSNELE